MSKEFQTRQAEIYELEALQKQARKAKDWDLESQYYGYHAEVKRWQQQVIIKEWKFILVDWFTTDSAAERLNTVLRYGIVQVQQDKQLRNKFVTQKHDLRAPITKAKELRFWTYWRDAAQCVYCHTHLDKSNGQIDHVIPISAWPAEFMFLAEDISNLVASCKSCNRQKLNFLQLPEKPILHVEIDTCLPSQSITFNDWQICSNAESQDCEICGLPSILVFCNVHGLAKMQLCKLSSMKKYLGHD